MEENKKDYDLSDIVNILNKLDKRLSAVESAVNNEGVRVEEDKQEPQKEITIKKEKGEDIEFRFGEQWFGKIGVIAFLFGIFYVLVSPLGDIPDVFVFGFGFFVSVLLIASLKLKSGLIHSLSGYLLGSGLIILYFSTLRLHYFSSDPLITNKLILIILLFIVSGIAYLFAYYKKSVYLTSIALTSLYITALLSNIPLLIFITLVAGSFSVVKLSERFTWSGLIMYSIPLTYLIHAIWYINNPFLGNEIEFVTEWSAHIIFIPVYFIIYGVGSVVAVKTFEDDLVSILYSGFNTVLGYGLFLLISLTTYNDLAGLLNFSMSLVILAAASFHWIKKQDKISIFLYSMTAYAALSAAIITTFSYPAFFVGLCWQSLAVVSTALWFRSKFIVVTNFFIFIGIVLAFILSWSGDTYGGLSFGLVALISARVINWQNERLELKTENIRNGYLVIAFLVIPYILYFNLPGYLVGISLIILAFLYYIIGKILNNKKYRLLASGTMMMSLVIIFISGLTSSETTYKIISFILVSLALLIISFTYARTRTGSKST